MKDKYKSLGSDYDANQEYRCRYLTSRGGGLVNGFVNSIFKGV